MITCSEDFSWLEFGGKWRTGFRREGKSEDMVEKQRISQESFCKCQKSN